MLYLELGCLRVRTIIKCKRINFLHYLLTSSEKTSLHQFFKTQLKYPTKNDWTETIKGDLEDFDINDDFDTIKKTSKDKFKKFVKIKAKEFELRFMSKSKESLSKIRYIKHKKLNMSNYLELETINAQEAKAIFQFRSRMAQFNGNYKGKNPIKICPLCSSHPDTQEWSFKCSEILKNIEIKGNYSDIIEGNITKNVAKSAHAIIKFREMSQAGAQ